MATPSQLAPNWVPPELIDAWYAEYLDAGGMGVTGSEVAAAEVIRTDSRYREMYDRYFPGNRRDDGSLRLVEQEYVSRIASYENALLSVNVNPEMFGSYLPNLIAGDVTPSEFVTRVESMYERVTDAMAPIRDYYATYFALDMSDSAIVASFLEPEIGDAILERRIAISEIGGEASRVGFDVSARWAESLVQAGIERENAANLFGSAAAEIPVFDTLARRHADPDDDFDLGEFTQAAIFNDPEQRRRIRRLASSERASFTGDAAAIGLVEDRAGGLRGLGPR
jgi:hypothetical protein